MSFLRRIGVEVNLFVEYARLLLARLVYHNDFARSPGERRFAWVFNFGAGARCCAFDKNQRSRAGIAELELTTNLRTFVRNVAEVVLQCVEL